MKKITIAIMAILTLTGATGCRPYKTPKIVEIDTQQTAFLIDLLDDGSGQAKIPSAEYLEERRISAKEIELTQRWLQRGRLWFHGEWRPSQRVIVVDRTPVARKWTAETDTGTSNAREMLEAESLDSVGVSIGFALTASVLEEDAATYLYYATPNRTLADVVDSQVFNAAQAVFSEIAAKYEVRDLRNHKQEIVDTMRDRLIPEFKEIGVTIAPTMGIIGGLVYDNPAIQQAIDEVFIAQTLEAKKEAEAVAQLKENERELTMAKNEAEKRKLEAEADAYEITARAEAIEKAGPSFYQIQMLEVFEKAVDKWDGTVPNTLTGSVPFQHMMIPVDPTPTAN